MVPRVHAFAWASLCTCPRRRSVVVRELRIHDAWREQGQVNEKTLSRYKLNSPLLQCVTKKIKK
jgi:hypothetical protein